MTLPMVAMSALNQSADSLTRSSRAAPNGPEAEPSEIEYPLFRFFGERPRSAEPRRALLSGAWFVN